MSKTARKSLIAAAQKFGAERIKISKQCKSREDWKRLWKKSAHPFVFKPGDCWDQCCEYVVADFEAEVGFWIDIMGFGTNAFGSEYAMVCPPKADYFFSVVLASSQRKETKPGMFRLSFMLDGIQDIGKKLKKRGVVFSEALKPYGSPNSPMLKGTFLTPAGIEVELWGMKK